MDLAALTVRAHAIAASHDADVDSLAAVVQEMQAALEDMGASCGMRTAGRGRRESTGSTASSVSVASTADARELARSVPHPAAGKGKVCVALLEAEAPCTVTHCPPPACAPPAHVQQLY